MLLHRLPGALPVLPRSLAIIPGLTDSAPSPPTGSVKPSEWDEDETCQTGSGEMIPAPLFPIAEVKPPAPHHISNVSNGETDGSGSRDLHPVDKERHPQPFLHNTSTHRSSRFQPSSSQTHSHLRTRSPFIPAPHVAILSTTSITDRYFKAYEDSSSLKVTSVKVPHHTKPNVSERSYCMDCSF